MSAPAFTPEEGRVCATCGSPEFLSEGHGKGGLNDVCRPCFFIWYDGDILRNDRIRGEDIRDACLKARAEQTWPFQLGGQFNRGESPSTQGEDDVK